MTRAKRDFGHIRQLGSGRFQSRYFKDGYYVNGPATFATKTEARKWLVSEEQKIDAGKWTDPRSGKVTIREFAAGWLDRKSKTGWAVRTTEFTTWLLDKYVLPQLGEVALADLKTARVRRWHADLAAERGQGQAGKAYRALRTMMNEAVADDFIPASPCTIKSAGNQPASDRPTVEPGQVGEIAGELAARYVAMTWTAALSGLREGELFALERRDIDLLDKTITVTKQAQDTAAGRVVTAPKSEAGRRTVSIPDFLASALEGHLAAHVGAEAMALVFTNVDGAPLNRNHWNKTWRRAVRAAGYEGIHFHDLRSCALTLRAQQGATLKELMSFGGQSTMTVAMIYQRATQERERELAAKTDDALRAALGRTG
ncbi:MAG TPA: site-specific integrase [Acidimicrobiales bacterium]|nr:site-specific integrase [Acidimicrobiales bacterium]